MTCKKYIFILLFVNEMCILCFSASVELFPYLDAKSCKEDEYFNTELFHCDQCDKKSNLEPSLDKLSCVCNENSRMITLPENAFLTAPQCEPCGNGSVQSLDKRFCIPCGPSNKRCVKCKDNEIYIERYVNGSYLPHYECVSCKDGTVPSLSKMECVACPIINPLAVNRMTKSCVCPARNILSSNVCVSKQLYPELADESSTYTVKYESGTKIESDLLHMQLRPAYHLCKLKNATACQLLANLCTLVLFHDNSASPCQLWKDARQLTMPNFPSLFYGEGDAYTVLHRKKINAQYTLNPNLKTSWMNFSTATFSFEGNMKGIKPLFGHSLNLCPGIWEQQDQSLRFGIDYKQFCQISVQQLLQDNPTEFLVPYLHFMDDGLPHLYSVPVLIKNINRNVEMSNWQLVKRFFVVDITLGVPVNSKNPAVIRYAKSIEIRVTARGKSEKGKIYPPYIVVEYGEIFLQEIEDNAKMPFQFSVKYEMESNMAYAIEVSIGVLSSFAVFYSGIQTWSHSRRSGKPSIDFATLVRLCIFSCGNIANAFFVVAIGTCVHTFVFYKGQTVVHVLLPNHNNEVTIRNYLIVAFSLKIVDIIFLIGKQVNVDIFLIDWERPKVHGSILRPPSSVISTPLTANSTSYQQPVSIWRTYFIANEWNELQTKRKINLFIHLVVVILLLEVIGLKNWGSSEPMLHLKPQDYLPYIPLSFTCRLAVGFLVNMTAYFLQLLFHVVLYERFIRNGIQQFVDICSVANISVFILMLERYGFYIHGRSVHGFADTDMSVMFEQLQREEDNLCGHRGLLPATEQQTFSMIVPGSLRSYYCKLMAPLTIANRITMSVAGLNSEGYRGKSKTDAVDKSIQAYHHMNRFLASFLEHALKDLDYEVRDKLFVESLLDIEFTDCVDRAVFYNDNGHSFDSVLFYGNEFILACFDIILFCFIEVLFQNYLLDIIVTALVYKFLTIVRQVGGRRNLAKKTLIDERFLI